MNRCSCKKESPTNFARTAPLNLKMQPIVNRVAFRRRIANQSALALSLLLGRRGSGRGGPRQEEGT
jgi:hypothetical protein